MFRHSVMSNSLRPHGLQPARLICSWNSPGKNTGVSCHALPHGIFPTQGSNPDLQHCRQILYTSWERLSFIFAGGAWQAAVHRVTKESNMTYQLNNNNNKIYELFVIVVAPHKYILTDLKYPLRPYIFTFVVC